MRPMHRLLRVVGDGAEDAPPSLPQATSVSSMLDLHHHTWLRARISQLPQGPISSEVHPHPLDSAHPVFVALND